MHKFEFMCHTCNEKFNVDFKYMLDKESLVCPNCSNALPDDAFQKLKTIATSLTEYEQSGVHNCIEKANHFAVIIH